MGTSFAFMMMVGTFIIMTRGAEYFLDIAADDQLLEKYIDQHKNRLERIYEENIRKPLWEQENLPSEAILDSHRKGPDIFFLLTSNVSCGSIPLLRQDGKIIMGDKIYQKFINLLPEKLSTKMHHLNEQETTPGIAPHEEIQRKNDLKKLNAYRQLFSAGAKYSLKASEKDLRILSCGWCKKQSICVGIGSILIIMMWTARQAYQDIQARPSKKN